MRQAFPIVASMLVFLFGVTSAQVLPCGTPFPLPVSDNLTRSCEIMKNNGAVCHKVMLVVTGFANASGYGASVASSNGNRVKKTATFVEFHITTKRGMSTLIGREFYEENKKMTGESYYMHLGLAKNIDSVMIAISRRLVRATVDKRSKLPPNFSKKQKLNLKSKKIPYILEAVFPLRESSGFCSENDIHYKANGAVIKIKEKRVNRKGSGYTVAVYKMPSF